METGRGQDAGTFRSFPAPLLQPLEPWSKCPCISTHQVMKAGRWVCKANQAPTAPTKLPEVLCSHHERSFSQPCRLPLTKLSSEKMRPGPGYLMPFPTGSRAGLRPAVPASASLRSHMCVLRLHYTRDRSQGASQRSNAGTPLGNVFAIDTLSPLNLHSLNTALKAKIRN